MLQILSTKLDDLQNATNSQYQTGRPTKICVEAELKTLQVTEIALTPRPTSDVCHTKIKSLNALKVLGI